MYDYSKMMLGALYINKNPQKILMIGLGGATLANAIKILVPSADLDIIEINPNMLSVAKQFFFFNPDKNTHIFVEDGYNFIKHSSENKYDIIIIDAFDNDYAPAPFLTLDFVKNIHKCLKSGGVVAVNTYNDGTQKRYDDYNKLESELYKTVFADLYKLVSPPSKIILAQKNNLLPSLDMIKQEASYWEDNFKSFGINSEWLVDKFKR